MVQRIEQFDPPEEVFRSLVENAGQIHGNGSSTEDLVNALCSDEGLAHVSVPCLQWFVMCLDCNLAAEYEALCWPCY